MILAVAAAMALGSCGAERNAPGHHGKKAAEVVVDRDCMVSVVLTDKTECAGADLDHLHCTGLTMTWKKGCETLRIAR